MLAKSKMCLPRYSLFLIFFSLISFQGFAKKTGDVSELQIGVKFKPKTCEFKAHKGDRIKVHYRGKLTDGTVFDSSFERGDPFEFELGSGQVIEGWDQGLLGACVGEKRKLKIPAKLGYGEQGSPPTIPGGATLIFDTELIAVNGKPTVGKEEDEDEDEDDTSGDDEL
ncbi:peptidyl-prolyl cis-trans isomerase FKBP15-2 [Brassica rapa]|uniref:peptidyl-prolyl cis-trans isomerase FKBP15-2 n=1 Tax=Brassica campestris TaxID=3711 RepID=UPI00142D6ACB|nr:peptidyl-prolyl cis-trans isomerase FKBP15-2 [Brassica rapa]